MRQVLIWLLICICRCAAAVGRVLRLKRPYALAIYKVDRIGDYILARDYIRSCILGTPGATLVALSESLEPAFRADGFTCAAVALRYDGDGIRMAFRNLPRLVWISLRVGADRAISFRHETSVMRDLFLIGVSPGVAYALNESHAIREASGAGCSGSDVLPAVLRWNCEIAAFVLGCSARRMTPEIVGRQTCDGSLVLCPYGGERIRDYPLEGWREALALLLNTEHFNAVRVLVAPKMHARAEDEFVKYLAGVSRSPVCAVVAPDLRGMEDIVAAAKLVICVETSIAHIATAMDKPTVVLIGGGHYTRFGPWRRSPRQIWLTSPLDCFNCDWQCRRAHPYCIVNIQSSTIARASIDAMRY